MTEALIWADSDDSYDVIDRLIAQAQQNSQSLTCQIDGISEEVLLRLARPAPQLFSPMKRAAATLVSFCLAGSALPACQSSYPPTTSTTPSKGHPVSPPQDPPSTSQVEKETPPEGTSRPPQPPCLTQQQVTLVERVKELVLGIDDCTPRVIAFGWGLPHPPIEVVSANSPSDDGIIERTIKKQLTPQELDCLVGDSIRIEIEGKRVVQKPVLLRKVNRCQSNHLGTIVMELDRDGKIVDIRAQQSSANKPPPSALLCIRRAVRGLRFHCLASSTVTERWQPVILE